MERYHYRAYGLLFCSELQLPELAEVPAAPADVTIRRGALPRPDRDFSDGWYRAGRRSHTHAWPDVGVFHVEDGKEIVVEAASSASDALVRHVLLGAVMGPLLLQRSMLPLHAATLEIHGRAFAFSAASGDGKSTLAASLYARGHRLVSDDVLGVPWDSDGPITVPFAIPRMKLLPDALGTLGYALDSTSLVYGGIEKRAVAAPPPAADPAPVLFGGIFLLEWADVLEIAPVDPKLAVLHLMQQTFKPDVVVRSIGGPEHMKACASVAERVPVYRLRRPRDLGRLDEVADAVTSYSGRASA